MLANELDTYQLVNHSINNVILVTLYLIKLTDVRLSLFSKARKTRSYTQRVCLGQPVMPLLVLTSAWQASVLLQSPVVYGSPTNEYRIERMLSLRGSILK